MANGIAALLAPLPAEALHSGFTIAAGDRLYTLVPCPRCEDTPGRLQVAVYPVDELGAPIALPTLTYVTGPDGPTYAYDTPSIVPPVPTDGTDDTDTERHPDATHGEDTSDGEVRMIETTCPDCDGYEWQLREVNTP